MPLLKPLEIVQVPLLSDNYGYLVHEPVANLTGIVDPSEAQPVLEALEREGWTLTHIINTHHHWDHTGGNLEIKEATGATIVGPAYDEARIPGIDVTVSEDQLFKFGNATAEIIFIPGHTSGHIAFWFADDAALFCGDTLFAMGCGRLFEGTPAQMWDSLHKLMRLPDETRIYCGHEYTEANGNFALTLEPGNADLITRMKDVRALRADGQSTIPSLMGLEKKTNPFLRAPNVDTWAEVRAKKDRF